jgi:flagellar biosynthesis chaperone FliJ
MSDQISNVRNLIGECLTPLRDLQKNAEIDDKSTLSTIISKLENALDSINSISTEFNRIKSKISDNNCPKCHEPNFKLLNQSGGKYNYKCSSCGYIERTSTRY